LASEQSDVKSSSKRAVKQQESSRKAGAPAEGRLRSAMPRLAASHAPRLWKKKKEDMRKQMNERLLHKLSTYLLTSTGALQY
jgi:hypothetical protein